jgi:cytochrome c oxidase cbb3-type subunit IV
MQIYSILGSVFTVISFVVFVGILLWAFSGRRKQAFDQAAQEPFALPDEVDSSSPDNRRGLPR